MNEKGFTLTEVLLATAIIGVVGYAAARMHAPISRFFTQSTARQRATMEARSCLDTMGMAFRVGKANTVQISTPVGPPVVPNSQIDFQLTQPAGPIGGYEFQLANRQILMRYMDTNYVVQPGSKVMASNVTSLIFTADYRDPSVIYVSIQTDTPMGSFEGATVFTIQMLNQEFHMMVNT